MQLSNKGNRIVTISPSDVRLSGLRAAVLPTEAVNKEQLEAAIAAIPTPSGLTDQVLYGSDYGIVADGITDDTAAFNTFMAACKAGERKGELQRGTIRFASKPNDIDFNWDLGGKGLVTTVIIRDYNGTGVVGCLNLTDGSSGTRIHDMSVQSSSGKTAGSMICVTSSTTYAISGISFENLWLTTGGTDTQTYTLYIDGTLKTTSPSGIRDVFLKNVHAFGATDFAVGIQSVIGLSWMGGGIYPAGGTGNGVVIGGINTANNKSTFINLNLSTCGGLNLTNCWYITINSPSIGLLAGVSVNNANTCSLTQIIGYPAGTVLGNWVDSGVRRPGAAFATT